jgi:hypothetical protein
MIGTWRRGRLGEAAMQQSGLAAKLETDLSETAHPLQSSARRFPRLPADQLDQSQQSLLA